MASFYRALPQAIRDAILARDEFTCQDCGRRGVPGYRRECVQVHHVVSERSGGTNDPSNLITVCVACHKVRDRAEWAEGLNRVLSRRGYKCVDVRPEDTERLRPGPVGRPRTDTD